MVFRRAVSSGRCTLPFISGLGFRVQGSEYRVQAVGLGVEGLGPPRAVWYRGTLVNVSY